MTTRWVSVGHDSTVPEGHLRLVWISMIRPVVVLRIDGELRSYQGVCSHEETEFEDGDIQDGRLTCPLHFSQFDARSGRALEPPASLPLVSYPVTIRDGTIYIELPDDGQPPYNVEA